MTLSLYVIEREMGGGGGVGEGKSWAAHKP